MYIHIWPSYYTVDDISQSRIRSEGWVYKNNEYKEGLAAMLGAILDLHMT